MSARFYARVDLTNTGLASTTRYWKFSVERNDGLRIDFEPAKDQWEPPPDLFGDRSFWTFEQINKTE